jgi:hypothetical protein
LNHHTHTTHALCLLIAGLFCLGNAARVRADVPVDTAYQSWGIAPRLEVEIGPQFAWGFGHACRNEPAASGATPTRACDSNFGMLGGQVLALVRPFNHWALGPFFAHDVVLGTHEVRVELAEDAKKSSYSRSANRLAVEVRWYSRGVSTSGLYVALHAGALWWSDTLKPVADGVTQLAPEVGVELGGVFAPYQLPGTALGLQAWVAWLRNAPQRTIQANGSTYGYGTYVFVGLIGRFELGISL